MGDAILFAERNQLPSYTRNVINSTKDAHVYNIGSANTISAAVEREIRGLDARFVDRISGSTPYEVAVNFAKYKSPFDSVSGALFARLGKHTPILVVSRGRLPDVTKNYIESVKPEPKPDPRPPFYL